MAGGVIIGKFCIYTVIVSLFWTISWSQQAPFKFRCVDKQCQEPIGHAVAPQDYNGDGKEKLNFKEGDNLTLIGEGAEYYLARSGDNENSGLVAKQFIKKPIITMEPAMDVDLRSLVNSPSSIQDAEQVEPTRPNGCIVDGTSVTDPELCPQIQPSVSPSDISSGENPGMSTVPTPALSEDSTTESSMTSMITGTMRDVLTTLASAITPSGGSKEVIANTDTVTKGTPQDSSNSWAQNIATDKASAETSGGSDLETPPEKPTPQEVAPEERGPGNPMPQNLSDVDTPSSAAASPQPSVESEVGDTLNPTVSPVTPQQNETTDETEGSVGATDSLPETSTAQQMMTEEPPKKPSEKVVEQVLAQKSPAVSTAAPSAAEMAQSEKPESVQPLIEVPADAISSDSPAPGSAAIGEPALTEPTLENVTKAFKESVMEPSEGILAPSSPLPVTDGSSASQTKKLPEPKVTKGAPPKNPPPPANIRPTRLGHSHFHTRNAPGHSHHGHSHHGHSHHDHSHHDHVSPAVVTTPEEPKPQSHSYPGEKPSVDPVPEKPTEPAAPAASTPQVEDQPALEETKSAESPEKKEPEQYKVNTVEQICERNDGVGCDGEPVSTKPAEQRISSSKPRSEDSALREYVGLILSTIPEPARSWLSDLEKSGVSSHVIVLTFLCGLLASFLVAFFSFITHSSKESALLDYIARLEQQLFTLKREREVLLEEPRETTQVPDEVLERHEDQIRMLQNRKAMLESELACSKESILRYTEALREAQETIAEMEVDYTKKQEELMEEVNELRIERAGSETLLEEKENKMSELRDTNAQLLQEAQIWDERLRELTAKLDEVTLERDKANKQLSTSVSEIESLKAGLKSLSVLEKAREAAEDTEDEDEVIARLLEVQTVSAENESLKERNAALEEETAEAKAQLEKWRVEVESLKTDVKQALKQKQDSEQKLQVLTDYFKDKELTLQRDVVKQESLRQQKENDALGINEQLELYREQNITIQTQLTAVKEELEISERRYKRQVMEHEKRAHDNWMAYKNASKTVEELQNELQILRQQLNQFQKERETAERMVNLPQNRPRPPPPLPLPLPKGVVPMGIPPIPLPNGVFKDLPSPPMGRYIEGARRTPPAGVPLPSVLYQSKALSSRHSSDHSVRSGGSRGGIVSPDLRRSSNHRRSDRGDRSKDSNR